MTRGKGRPNQVIRKKIECWLTRSSRVRKEDGVGDCCKLRFQRLCGSLNSSHSVFDQLHPVSRASLYFELALAKATGHFTGRAFSVIAGGTFPDAPPGVLQAFKWPLHLSNSRLAPPFSSPSPRRDTRLCSLPRTGRFYCLPWRHFNNCR